MVFVEGFGVSALSYAEQGSRHPLYADLLADCKTFSFTHSVIKLQILNTNHCAYLCSSEFPTVNFW